MARDRTLLAWLDNSRERGCLRGACQRRCVAGNRCSSTGRLPRRLSPPPRSRARGRVRNHHAVRLDRTRPCLRRRRLRGRLRPSVGARRSCALRRAVGPLRSTPHARAVVVLSTNDRSIFVIPRWSASRSVFRTTCSTICGCASLARPQLPLAVSAHLVDRPAGSTLWPFGVHPAPSAGAVPCPVVEDPFTIRARLETRPLP